MRIVPRHWPFIAPHQVIKSIKSLRRIQRISAISSTTTARTMSTAKIIKWVDENQSHMIDRLAKAVEIPS